ncbi:heme ABC transporter ATP-binding protein [Anaerobranca gottschalkii]|uniref:Iron complex transport system ATP-binding protein n=1 Tax=Anaerobranca gottschalkii DSM 13577 TaxID=1120990 RepID=A0A1I0A257_9FIRM|nr:heme ABC transporter ATP-binding protein [Anaerobranca gottschalkii]SES88024.1 iron complex transport system ATP-binding protein [Anaerobranca gottschalkii DSM 13577]
MSQILISGLSWKYETQKILTDIKLNIERGKFYSIIGPNGSGKTTLLKNILKILPVEKKTIFLQGQDINKISIKNLAKKIAHVPQDTKIDFDFTVLDLVMMGRNPYLKHFQLEGEKDLEIVKGAMEATGVWEFRNKSINNLSGGERQRVIISRALAQQSDILLLDEPISNLDLYHQIEILDLIHKIVKEKGKTVIAVLHDLNLAAQYSDYVILLNKGKVFTEGKPEEVITEKNISEVYKINCRVIKNPCDNTPLVITIANKGEKERKK